MSSMERAYSKNVLERLACPHCKQALSQTAQGFVCSACQSRYTQTAGAPLDLRPNKPTKYQIEFELTSDLLPQTGFVFSPSFHNAKPEVEFSGVEVPFHLSPALMSHFPRALSEKSLMLDLGCGNAIHREVAEHAGFEYVGLDYREPQASFLGDAHALPFKDESFEFILSIAVLEHLRFPFVAMREAYRVLKPGGKFIGTVAFLEPFHDNSFYHHTHLGVFNSLQQGGFKIEIIAPSNEWSGLLAQANMTLFPNLSERVTKLLVWPLHTLHRLWWRLNSRWWQVEAENPRLEIENQRVRDSTGALTFIAFKE